MATAGLVAPISVFRYNDELVVGGLPWEFIQRMVSYGGAKIEYPLGNISFSPEAYKLTPLISSFRMPVQSLIFIPGSLTA